MLLASATSFDGWVGIVRSWLHPFRRRRRRRRHARISFGEVEVLPVVAFAVKGGLFAHLHKIMWSSRSTVRALQNHCDLVAQGFVFSFASVVFCLYR